MRSAGLDLVKWMAIGTMVADHMRYIWPAAQGLFIVGRFAFPLFCLAMAVNVARAGNSSLRYLGWLLAFAVLSEAPYRWLDHESQTFSIIPTLTLGLLVAWGVQHQQSWVRLAGLAAILLAAVPTKTAVGAATALAAAADGRFNDGRYCGVGRLAVI